MDERLRESISALMDDEANELELQRLMSHVERDSLNDTWQRYHAVRDVMRNEATFDGQHDLMNIDVSGAVAEWIDNDSDLEGDVSTEEIVEQDNVSSLPRAGGFLAVAASVLFAVIFVYQNNNFAGYPQGPEIVSNQGVEGAASNQTVSAKQPKMIDHIGEEHARRLNQYLLRHAEHSMIGARQGAMPFVRVASVNSVGI